MMPGESRPLSPLTSGDGGNLLRRARFTTGPSLRLWLALRLRILRFLRIDLLAVDHRIGRIHNDLVLCVESGENFDLRSEVPSESYGYKLGFIVGIHGGDLQTLGTENQGTHRKNEGRHVTGNLQMHFRVSAGQKLSRGVVHIHLDQQSPGSDVNRIGGANQRTLKTTSRIFAQGKVGREAGPGGNRILLWNIDIHAQRFYRSDVEEFFLRVTGALVDQLAHIRIPRGDHPIKRSVNILERFGVL